MGMIEDARGRIDYDESGQGPTIVLVPGSCSTGAAWRPVMARWANRYRCVTTSVLGYGGTAERRTAGDPDIAHEAAAVEAVVARAGGPVHLVGHSWGGLIGVAVALRGRAPLRSLTVAEAPAAEALPHAGEHRHYRAFRAMNEVYSAAFRAGDRNAIANMIDFFGGAGTFAAWPERVRAYAMETTAVNLLDWESAVRFDLAPATLARVAVPALVVTGGASNPAVRRANEVLAEGLRAEVAAIPGAAHFMIATHAAQLADLIAAHVDRVERAAAEQGAAESTPLSTPDPTFEPTPEL